MRSTPIPDGSVALLGDAHLCEDDPEVDSFIQFLDSLPSSVTTLGILGDLFSAWIGRLELIRPHHVRVLEALRRLKRRGCRLLYIEGNHDFFLTRLYEGDPFDLLAPIAIDVELGGRSVHLAHGDLVNVLDRQYRAWRAVSKSKMLFGLFNLLPAAGRLRVIDRLEAALKGTNQTFKRGFPMAQCEAYARPRIRGGRDVLVFGHYHVERRIEYREDDRTGTVFVLPAWRDDHRYLRIEPGGEPAFVSS
jgi:UDP-2,3-diacylglucosamine hydrolase